jgi:hypothetical protein
MSLHVSYDVASEGTAVPYGPIFDDIRRNNGFRDLRDKPEEVANVPETAGSEALRRLLVFLAQPGCPIFSLGCDLGQHEEPEQPAHRRQVAGGYIQVAARNYDAQVPAAYHEFAKVVARSPRKASVKDLRAVNYVLTPVRFKFDPVAEDVYPTVWAWFYAFARTPEQALSSRERLIDSFAAAFCRPDALKGLRD